MTPSEMVRREISRAQASVRQAFRAVLKGLTISTKIQRISGEGLAGEEIEEMELFQHFGFTSAPPAGTEYIPLPLGGRTSASVVIGTEHGDFRFVLDNQGESCVYNEWGDFAHFKKDRSIHVKAQEKVVVETKVFRVEASERIELVSPVFLTQASTSARFETPVVQATQLLQPQQLTIGAVPGGVGVAVATMTGGTVNFNNVNFGYQNCTLTLTGGTIRHDNKNIGSTHNHNETGAVTNGPNA
ncbi:MULTISPECIES: phage baseplate assembly protein domain-containing protein [unclassified Variovorax]|uniref:phage baseplate assembly protein domain-containing protein n=1 Tax=unclassified Variovorax TaxID=663243 RepID=UPI003F46194B